MNQEFRPYSFKSNDWQQGLIPAEISALMQELNTNASKDNQKVFQILLSAFSQFALSVLTTVESGAFQQPMGESLVKSWQECDPYLVFVAEKEGTVGFVTIDERLKKKGIYYIDLAAVFPTDTGLGKNILYSTLEHILNQPNKNKIVLARTQNPAAAMSIRSALRYHGLDCFPIDRRPDPSEQKAIKLWANEGHVRTLGSNNRIDSNLAIFYGAYLNWQPVAPTAIKPGTFQQYLERDGINYQQFVKQGNAFIVGGSLEKNSA